MYRRSVYGVLLVAGVLLCSTGRGVYAEEYDPYKVPRAQVRERIHVIGLTPTRVYYPIEATEAAHVRTSIPVTIRRMLERRKYTVVEPAVVDELWRDLSGRLGGIVDPVTGEVREAHRDLVVEHVLRELAHRFDVDALLVSHLAFRPVPPFVDTTVFGGHLRALKEDLIFRGEPIPGSLWWWPQRVLAAFLEVQLVDRSGFTVYSVASPIRWTDVYVAGGHEARPEAGLYSNAAFNDPAVHRALQPLEPAGGPTPASTPR